LKQQPIHEVDFEGRPILIFADGDFRVQAFHRTVEQQALSFERLDGPVPRFVDQHGSVWNEWGQGISGQLAGKQLEPVRGYLTEWYEWVSAYPKTEIF
jgi:hypothetical protein